MEAKSLPIDNDAEIAVLGCIMFDNRLFTSVIDMLSHEDFYNPKNSAIFEALEKLYKKSSAMDYTTLVSCLEADEVLDKAGGPEYIANIVTYSYSTANIDAYVELVKKASLKRKAIDRFKQLVELGYDASIDANEYITQSENVVYELSKSKKTGELESVVDTLETVKRNIERNARNQGTITGLDTGFNNLNNITLGLQPSNLIILAARPAVGKSAFAMNLALNVAERGKSVAVFNLEMSADQLAERIIASDSYVDLTTIRSGKLNAKQNIAFSNSYDKIKKLNLWFDDSGNNTVEDIRTKCRKLAATRGLDFIVIDYLQLINVSSSKGRSRNEEVSEISRSLKLMARELNVPVLALSQLSRKVEEKSRSDRRPGMADLRDSGAIEQDADIVTFLYREGYYEKNTDNKEVNPLTELIVGKNRSGSTGTLYFSFSGKIAKFVESVGDENND